MKVLFNYVVRPLLGIVFSMSLYARSTAPPPVERTGAEADGGLSCTACHRLPEPADTRARIIIAARPYNPGGARQMITVMVTHPEAMRWGFQLTARLASDPQRTAGQFRQNDDIQVICSGGAPGDNCAGAKEFASHRLTSTYTGQRNMAMWEVPWVPPATDVGEVIFYAAGNAANGNLNNQGDSIATTSLRIAPEVCNLTETPRIAAIRNGASFIDGPLALNTMITLSGTGFHPAGRTREAGRGDIEGGKFPTTLGCVSVRVGETAIPMAYVQGNQINAQLPTSLAQGTVPVRVVLNPGTSAERRSDPVNISVGGDHSPAFFRFLPTPCIAAVNQDGTFSGDPSLLPNVRGSRIGEVVSLFATGLGPTDPVFQSGEIATSIARVRDQATIEWGDRVMDAADVLYVGLAPGLISGAYQINIRVPSFARTGVHNQVRIRIGGRLSPEGTTLYVAPN